MPSVVIAPILTPKSQLCDQCFDLTIDTTRYCFFPLALSLCASLSMLFSYVSYFIPPRDGFPKFRFIGHPTLLRKKITSKYSHERSEEDLQIETEKSDRDNSRYLSFLH